LSEVGLFIAEDRDDGQSEFPEDGRWFAILENALYGSDFIVRGDPAKTENHNQIGCSSQQNYQGAAGPSSFLARFKKSSSTTLSK